MKERLLSALSMARGAGKLKIGLEASKDAVKAGAPLVILASDTSQRTKQEILSACSERTQVMETEKTQEQIAEKFGWRFGVAAVTERNLAALVRKAADQDREDTE